MCFKIFVDLIIIWNFLRNIKYDEYWFEIYFISYLFVFKDFMRFMKKKNINYISNFVNLKYLIHETVLTFLIGLLAHSLLLIIFRYPRPWQRMIFGVELF